MPDDNKKKPSAEINNLKSQADELLKAFESAEEPSDSPSETASIGSTSDTAPTKPEADESLPSGLVEVRKAKLISDTQGGPKVWIPVGFFLFLLCLIALIGNQHEISSRREQAKLAKLQAQRDKAASLLAKEKEAREKAERELAKEKAAREKAEREKREREQRQLADITPARLSNLARKALLPDLRQVTPQGVQLKDLTVARSGNVIKLSGVTMSPKAKERINALLLGLQKLPQTPADGVRLMSTREAAGSRVTFRLLWNWDPVAKPSLQELLLQEDRNTP